MRCSPKTAKTLRQHTKRRALERFGLALTKPDLSRIVKLIQNGQAEFYDRQSLNVTRWIVTVQNQTVGVAYDKLRKSIRTVMPVEYLSQDRPRDRGKK